jgi:Na+-driven multidrug efflux pump
VIVSVSTLLLNVVLTYGLLLGRLGLPDMGIPGAALAIAISRTLEAIILVTLVYLRGGPIAAPVSEMIRPGRDFIVAVFKPVLPVIITEILWSFGTTTYKMIYGKIGTDAIAAINIMEAVDLVAMVPFFALTGATSVLVGNSIGAGDNESAFRHALRSIGLGVVMALGLGGVILLMRDPVISLYRVTPETQEFTRHVLLVLGLFLWLRVSNMIQIISALRSGGDTWFSLLMDGCTIWVVGIPLAWVAAFVFKLPIGWVYLFVMSEETVKWIVGLWRVLSRKWIHNLAEAV